MHSNVDASPTIDILASNQTKQPSTRNACHQSVKVKSVSTTVETTTTFPDNPDQITGPVSKFCIFSQKCPIFYRFDFDFFRTKSESGEGLISFLNEVYPKVSAQLEMNLRLAKKFRQVAKSTLIREMGLSYPRHTLGRKHYWYSSPSVYSWSI